jgi:hypothetical protein
MFNNIENLCDPHNTQRFTCAGSKVVYNASIIWGTIGPQRMFQSGQVYSGLMYFFILGVSRPYHVIPLDALTNLASLSSQYLYTSPIDDSRIPGLGSSMFPSSSMQQETSRQQIPVSNHHTTTYTSISTNATQLNTPYGSFSDSFSTS